MKSSTILWTAGVAALALGAADARAADSRATSSSSGLGDMTQTTGTNPAPIGPATPAGQTIQPGPTNSAPLSSPTPVVAPTSPIPGAPRTTAQTVAPLATRVPKGTTGAVRRAISSDPLFSRFDVQISQSQSGNVLLQGTVETPFERDAIGARAAQLAGGQNVDNEILVVGSNVLNPGAPPANIADPFNGRQGTSSTDRSLAALVRRNIFSDQTLSPEDNVRVSVFNGFVTLDGQAASEQDRQAIADKAAVFVGPGNVSNEILVVP